MTNDFTSCYWCRWHNWEYDRCALKGRIVTDDVPACEQYEEKERNYDLSSMGF